VIQNPGFLPDHAENLITGSLCHSQHIPKISERSVHTFRVIFLTHRQTDKQTKSDKNITSLAEYTSTHRLWDGWVSGSRDSWFYGSCCFVLIR